MLETSAECYEFRDFRLDVARRQLLRNDDALPLNHKAFHILLLLVRNHGCVLSKDKIIDEIWQDSFVEDSNLTQHIYILRKTLEGASVSKDDSIIRTIPKQGYMFTEAVRVAHTHQTEHVNSNGNGNGNGHVRTNGNGHAGYFEFTTDRTDQPNSAPHTRSKLMPLLGAALFLIVLISTVGIMRYGMAPPAENKRVNSIAVLPFRTVAGTDDTKLGFGMADAVITKLSKLRGVQVRPTSAVFRYVDQKDADVGTVGRGLGVDAVLEGTLQIEGDRMRVNVQLVDVKQNMPLWADRFDERANDVFSVQDAIAARVATSLDESLTGVASKKATASSAEAYQNYLLGFYFYNKRSKDSLQRAENYLTEAIRLDPQYAPSHAILADVLNMQVYYRFVDDLEERGTRASAEAETALKLDEQSAEAHIAMAQYLATSKWTEEKARERRRHLERAIELAPTNSTAHLRYAWVLYEDKDLAGAESQMLLAQKNDPLSAVTNGAACDILLLNRKFAEGLAYCQKSFDLEPGIPGARERVANAYLKLGQIDKAIDLIKQSLAQNPDNLNDRSLLAIYYARSGKTDEARKMLAELTPQIDKDPEMASNLALAYKALGEDEKAREWLHRALAKARSLKMRLKYDADYDAFRTDPSLKDAFATRSE